jgi:hypothetical protein
MRNIVILARGFTGLTDAAGANLAPLVVEHTEAGEHSCSAF